MAVPTVDEVVAAIARHPVAGVPTDEQVGHVGQLEGVHPLESVDVAIGVARRAAGDDCRHHLRVERVLVQVDLVVGGVHDHAARIVVVPVYLPAVVDHRHAPGDAGIVDEHVGAGAAGQADVGAPVFGQVVAVIEVIAVGIFRAAASRRDDEGIVAD